MNKAPPPESPSLDLMIYLLSAEPLEEPRGGWLELTADHYPDSTLGDYLTTLKSIIANACDLNVHARRERAIVYELQFWQNYDPLISPDVPIGEVVKIFKRRGHDHVPRDLH
ncbi:MAG: hypothetical protein AAAB35_01160 [Phyllobacterium sp.]|uniref:hypothetical protein n=1 Tax=Phyllobacterium sp. TaxID=1871046 RepID=UPI0030F23795